MRGCQPEKFHQVRACFIRQLCFCRGELKRWASFGREIPSAGTPTGGVRTRRRAQAMASQATALPKKSLMIGKNPTRRHLARQGRYGIQCWLEKKKALPCDNAFRSNYSQTNLADFATDKPATPKAAPNIAMVEPASGAVAVTFVRFTVKEPMLLSHP